jgi:hypothetical protein
MIRVPPFVVSSRLLTVFGRPANFLAHPATGTFLGRVVEHLDWQPQQEYPALRMMDMTD